MSTLHPHSRRLENHSEKKAAILCFDHRFYEKDDVTPDDDDRRVIRQFLETPNVEFIQLGGGVGTLASLADFAKGKDFARICLDIAINKHGVTEVLLTNHTECGAYQAGGHSFETLEAEKAFHESELRAAQAQAQEWFPNTAFRLGFLTVDENDNVVVEPVE